MNLKNLSIWCLDETLKMKDGPIELKLDQHEGTLVVKSKNFELWTNELKDYENYRLVIIFRFLKVKIDVEIK